MLPTLPIAEFDSGLVTKASVKCLVRLDSFNLTCGDKVGGKIRASLTVRINSEEIHMEPNVGELKSKTGIFAWNNKTASGGILPVSFPVYVNQETSIKIILRQVGGIPLVYPTTKILHS